MTEIVYNKLVRDGIPAIIAADKANKRGGFSSRIFLEKAVTND